MSQRTIYRCDNCETEAPARELDPEDGGNKPLVLAPEGWMVIRLYQDRKTGFGDVCSRKCAGKLAEKMALDRDRRKPSKKADS